MIHIHSELISAPNPDFVCDTRRQWYANPEGFKRIEQKLISGESDFANGIWQRESPDNGKSWGAWQDVYQESYQTAGKNEILRHGFEPTVHHPLYRHRVGCGMERTFLGGHTSAYQTYWKNGENTLRDHCFLLTRLPDGQLMKQLVSYETHSDYDSEKALSSEYLDRDQAYFGEVIVLQNGDILFPICADIRYCCKILGLNVEEVCPSCPQVTNGLIVVRGKWNASEKRYELSYSRPVVLSDLQSSRGVLEPTLAELPNGRILVVVRGSNVVRPEWNTRIGKTAPGFKWYCYSDDGGKNFTPLLPWHFDTRDVVYSSSTLSTLIRSEKSGKIYWIGNITDPCKTEGNYPRWPLCIGEVALDGSLIKDTVTLIDTQREGESELLQLSNFNILQDRETGNLELRLAKLGQFPSRPVWFCESWSYFINLGE
jgi:hypothetical protein